MLAIVVDSTAALSRGEAMRLGVTMVGNTYVVDGHTLVEGYMGENGDYASDLQQGRLTETHSPDAKAFEAAFSGLSEAGYDILCVTISSRLANTYRSACRGADMVGAQASKNGEPAPKIAVLDSLSGFSNTEFLAQRARKLDQQGLSFEQIIRDLVDTRGHQGICFSALTLDSLRTNGRLSMVPFSVTTTLNRYPLLTMQDGAITPAGMARGIDALAEKMVEQVPSSANDLILAHYGARGALIVELLRATKRAFPQAKVRVKDGGPVLSCNLGPGAASIAWAPAQTE